MILFVLQNAYTSEKHQFSNYEEWGAELLNSHTGRRLKEMIPDGAEYTVINASGNIGDNPNSCYLADTDYIKSFVVKLKPDAICACGKIAQDGCRNLGYEFVEAPHPAWRQLSKDESDRIRNILSRRLN